MTSSLDAIGKAAANLSAAKTALRDAIVQARVNGERVPAIAQAAGVTRQRVYQILAKTECKHPPERLYTGYSDGELWVACCDCGAVLR